MWKYEGNDTSAYYIPSSFCFVLVMKDSNTRGAAIAVGWNRGNNYIWRNNLHDDGAGNRWDGWTSVMTSANFSLSGTTLTITT